MGHRDMTRIRHASVVIRLARRPDARLMAVAVMLAGMGIVLSSAAPAAGRPVARPSLEYSCKSPGWQQIPVRVTVNIPETATVGQPIQPTRPAITVSVPRADIRHLTRGKSSTVSVTAKFRTVISQNGHAVADPWLLRAAPAPPLSAGSLMLNMSGTVQPVIVRTTGDITFTAVGLSLLLRPHTPDSTSGSATSPTASSPAATIPAISSPAATTPATPSPAATTPAASPAATTPAKTGRATSMRLGCTLNPGQSAMLATVAVTATADRGAAHAVRASTLLWEAAPGGSFSGSGGPAKLRDATTGTVITCTTSSTSGTLKSGRDLPPAGIASLTSAAFGQCSGPDHRTFTVTASASARTPWLLNTQSYDPATTVVTVTIGGIMASVSGPGCRATAGGPTPTTPGTVNGSYTDSQFTPSLATSPPGGTLHIWNVSGCSGLFGNGDRLSLTVTYSITPIQNMTPAYCPPFPVNSGFRFNRHFKFPKPPPGSTVTFPKPPIQGCAFIKGFADVKKLGEAALVGPGFGNLEVGKRLVTNQKFNYFETDSSGKLYYKPCPGNVPQCRAKADLPPVHATFLSFGFMPTKATLQITQTGTLTVVSVGTLRNGVLRYSKISALASIRVEKVLINGVPLKVGSNCRTVKPFKLVLIGKPPYQLQDGGVIIGMINVPPFTGCGVGENIDPIFNAAVSGPGNIVKLTQGILCTDWPIPPFAPGCPATVPKPIHGADRERRASP